MRVVLQLLGYLQSEWDAELDTTVAATSAAAVPPAVPTHVPYAALAAVSAEPEPRPATHFVPELQRFKHHDRRLPLHRHYGPHAD